MTWLEETFEKSGLGLQASGSGKTERRPLFWLKSEA
jgi:hypothetical protein